MSRVFLSYSRKDDGFVRNFYERLKADGVNCFFDKESIPWGANWVVELEKGLDECELIVLILSPDFCKSEWAKLESTSVMAEDPAGLKRKIRPLLLKDCQSLMPRFLKPIQSIDISSEEMFEKRYPDICRQLGGAPKEEIPSEDRNTLPPICKLPGKYRMPYRSLGNDFLGRVNDLWEIDDRLRENKTAVVQGVGVVVGMGGIGKTQLAVEYVHRFGKYYPGGVFWVDADQGLPALIVQVSGSAGIEIDSKRDEKEQLLQMWQRMSQFTPVLVVLDNFPNDTGLEGWLPAETSIYTLVTTRRKDLLKYSPFSLDVLGTDEGVELVNSGKRKFSPKQAAGLVEALGGLPLALELAKHFLNLRTDISIPGLLKEIAALGEMEALAIFAREYEKELPTRHNKEVAATFLLSWNSTSDFSKKVLRTIALLAPTPVPCRVLRKVLEVEGKHILEDPLSKSIRDLAQKHSLIELDKENDPLCHRLISAFVRETIDKNGTLHDRVVRTILDEMERTADDADTASLRELEKVVSHADHLLTSGAFDLKPGQAVDLANHIGWFHSRWGRFRVSETYRRSALQRAEASFKPGDPKIALCCAHLVEVLYYLGRYETAIEYYEKALRSDLKTYGNDHPNVAVRWNNLGSAYYSLGQYETAIEYFEKALRSDLKTYGNDHQKVAVRWNNLGSAYYSLGQYETAIEYYEKALRSDLKTYGNDHPNVALKWNNLGLAYYSLGRYETAIEYYEKALRSDLKTYGNDHPEVAVIWNNLGLAYKSLGQYETAIEYYEKALRSDLKTYGNDHPQVAIYWNNLGGAYYSLGQYETAIEYYEKALRSDLKTYGNDHPDVAVDWNNLGGAYKALGQYEKAIEYYEKALRSDLKTYGNDHPQVAIYWNNLGMTYDSLGQYETAIEYYEKALTIFRLRLGDDHPHTKIVKKNLESARTTKK